MILCPLCQGVGEVPTLWDRSKGTLAIFDTRRECPECWGCCMVPGVALVRVIGGDDPTVTRGYIWELFHLLRAYRNGWMDLYNVLAKGWTFSNPAKAIEYADLRDWLRGEFDVDYISACQCALYLAPRFSWYAKTHPVYIADFHPIV